MNWNNDTKLAGWNGTDWEPLTAWDGKTLTAGDMQEVGRRLKMIEGRFHKREPKISDKIIQEMRADRAVGLSIRKLAAKYDTSTRTIEKYTKT